MRKFKLNPHTKKLKWLMVLVLSIDTTCTLIGQPDSYWHSPLTGNEGNDFFRLFLVQGYIPFIIWSILYILAMLILVSLIPGRTAAVIMYALILGHYFGASTWLDYRFGFGASGPIIYGALISLAIVALNGNNNGSSSVEEKSSNHRNHGH